MDWRDRNRERDRDRERDRRFREDERRRDLDRRDRSRDGYLIFYHCKISSKEVYFLPANPFL